MSVETALEHGLSLFRENQPIEPAAILEFGVYMGHSLQRIADYVKDHELQNVVVAGFDSFEGLPHDWPNTVCKKGQFSTDGKIPEIPGTAIYPGWFDATIPQYLQDFPTMPVGLLHLDADLHSSTQTILRGLNHLIVPGTVIVCDEWTYNFAEKRDDQEQRAFKEWLVEFDREAPQVDFRDLTFEPQGNHDVGGERALFVVTR